MVEVIFATTKKMASQTAVCGKSYVEVQKMHLHLPHRFTLVGVGCCRDPQIAACQWDTLSIRVPIVVGLVAERTSKMNLHAIGVNGNANKAPKKTEKGEGIAMARRRHRAECTGHTPMMVMVTMALDTSPSASVRL